MNRSGSIGERRYLQQSLLSKVGSDKDQRSLHLRRRSAVAHKALLKTRLALKAPAAPAAALKPSKALDGTPVSRRRSRHHQLCLASVEAVVGVCPAYGDRRRSCSEKEKVYIDIKAI